MHTTTDLDLQLQAILADPDDDGARLAFADLLEEEGERERAEFIRYSVTYPHCGFVALTLNDPFPLLGLQSIGAWMWGETDEMGCVVSDFGRSLDYKEDRGFICAIRGKAADFLRHADALFAAHPITDVTLASLPPIGWLRGRVKVYTRRTALHALQDEWPRVKKWTLSTIENVE